MRWMLCASILAGLSGCHAFYVDVDGRIAERASYPVDVQPATTVLPPITQSPAAPVPGQLQYEAHDQVVLITGEKDKEPMLPDVGKPSMMDRLKLKEGVLPFKVKDIEMWPRGATEKEKDEAIKKQFPPLPTVPALPKAVSGPDGRPLTLTDLQQIALRTNPKIRQAHLDIESARGQALQAGLYPNPSVGYESSSIGQGNQDGKRTPGQQGGFVEQTIVTMGKRTLARQAALRDIEIMEQNLRQAESELQAQVRSGYFAVLAARENHRVTKGLAELTDELFAVLLAQIRVGEVAAYELLQIRVLAMQTRQTLSAAQYRYQTAWRQLAATLGAPQMPLTELEGRIDMPVPHYEHDRVLAYVLANHTDVVNAQLGVDKNRFLVRLAEVQPYPDVTAHVAFQKDFTTPPNGAMANVVVSVPVPLFDRNQGGIQSARAVLRRALEDNQRVRNDLTSRTAEAFERYENNRKLLEMYKKDILPNQVQAFRAAVARHVVDRGVSYLDVVTIQQTLTTLIGSYLGSLNDQWTAVVDISNLLQTRDLFQTQPYDEVAPIPDVIELYRSGHRHRRE